MRPDDDSCRRMDDVEVAIEENQDTINLLAWVTSFLEEDENLEDQAGFFDRLRTLTGMPDADSETMFDVADYILWALDNDMELSFDLTEEDLRYVKLADEAGQYEDYAAQPDQTQLGTWELQALFSEMSRVLRGDLDMDEAEVLTRYFPQAEEADRLPIFMLLAGHAGNITPLLELFNNHILPNPRPTSQVWLNYYKCNSCYGDDKHMMEVRFCNGPDLAQCETLKNFSEAQDETNGAISNVDFERWLQDNRDQYVQANELPSYDIRDICNVEYEYDASAAPFLDV